MKLQPDKSDLLHHRLRPGLDCHQRREMPRQRGQQQRRALRLAGTRFEDLTSAFRAPGRARLRGDRVRQRQRNRFPPAAWLRALMARRIGLETMDTQAACRTYNILAGEGRNVAAALLLEDAPAAPR
jgi:hypothetical protein